MSLLEKLEFLAHFTDSHLLDLRRVPTVIVTPGSDDKLLRLRVQSEGTHYTLLNLSEDGRADRPDQLPAVVREFLSTRTKGYEQDCVELGYDYWNACKLTTLPHRRAA